MPSPVSTVPAIPRASPRRTAVHHRQTSITARTTSVASAATSQNEPNHDGASATAAVTAR